ncbi:MULTISPECIES: hypothetical protein [unclassified Novosphingobium]|uniref:hypothetical protein n=1 Tax=unclassified Novosphingobium TaxID=2644732 RepID=UPI000D2F64C6|nr:MULTISPECIES: hypothetical protein [unclassified Novosphingobium]PTR11757.1 hypothetical protein C8K11_104116 [Novosphingobium sp. GV055]PUB04797.1 hypothetical protein C8K12_104116 [Novosphingobium sp. GV061]PUB21116.1 hypothetical protein C8K14_104116 [Novosphingobium sp. GV079]PUB42842.1 hypothetical protein C8K10_104116 [Novosphingobium sp. GV027]
MAESLGDAVLTLRTDDSAYTSGIDKAEAAANGLGKTLDACSGSAVGLADKINQAAQSGDRGARVWLEAGAAIDALAAAQAQAKAETDLAKASFNAGTISLEEYNRQILQTKAGLALLEDEHRKAQALLRQHIASTNQVTGATAGQKAGMMQLTQQLGDMSTMYSLGMRPQQIFASQIGQVAGAVQLLAGEGSGFARFLAGPWGVAITGAVMVLGPLIANLLAAEDATKKVELASDGLSDAQGVLGKMFDLTTGKVKAQNDMLRLNAELMAINLRAQAQSEKSNAQQTMDRFSQGSIGLSTSQKALASLGVPVGDAMARESEVRQLVADMRSGKLSGIGASRRVENMDFGGLAVSKEEFLKAVADGVSYPEKEKVAQAIENSLRNNELDPTLRQPDTAKKKKERKSKSGKTEEQIDAEFLKAMEGIDAEELGARQQLATSAQERADIAYQMLGDQRSRREADIRANKDFSEAQKKQLIAALDRLYGQRATDGSILVGNPGVFQLQVGRDQRQAEAQQANDMLARQATTLEAWAQVATSAKERARLEADALKIQQQIQTNLLEQQIASGQVADGAKARQELASQQAAARQGLSQRTAGPLASYAAGLRANGEDAGRQAEQLVVNELDYIHSSLTDAIASRLGIKDPLLKALIGQFIEQQIIKPIAQGLAQATTGSGGLGGFIGSLFGGGGGSSLASSAAATIADPQFAGLFADGGTIPAGTWGIVGEAGPERVLATGNGVQVVPNPARGQGGVPFKADISISGARGNQEIIQMVNAGVQQALVAYDSNVGSRVKDNLARHG